MSINFYRHLLLMHYDLPKSPKPPIFKLIIGDKQILEIQWILQRNNCYKFSLVKHIQSSGFASMNIDAIPAKSTLKLVEENIIKAFEVETILLSTHNGVYDNNSIIIVLPYDTTKEFTTKTIISFNYNKYIVRKERLYLDGKTSDKIYEMTKKEVLAMLT